ncbi:uncharacterized protein B0T15DRAFT_395441 [Chaetomium strumarium]|uniref:F-box domain-containing protein n=1 Tax=Chaetomium strumarium TaxID=1170767 RepID=A0AAJ0GW26_9PEZI|nr:hypothetical protein B0T15DRAFT_395441 [Chaetomium strumarium]
MAIPKQEDALLRVAAYRRRDLEFSVLHSLPEVHEPVLPSIARAFATAPVSSLGALTFHRLPTEILALICLFLDVRACFRFRQVNRAARALVSGLVEYRTVVYHGLEALRAILRTRLDPHFTFRDLYQSLCSSKCQPCGAFGGFLFLPTAVRCCFKCLRNSPQLALLDFARLPTIPSLRKATFFRTPRVTPGVLRRLMPVLQTMSVYRYCTKNGPQHRRIDLVPAVVASEVLKGLGATSADLEKCHWKMRAYPYQGDGLSIRYMAATAFPFLDRVSGRVEYGVSCRGCYVAAMAHGSEQNFDCSDRVYSRKGFLDHFQSCPEAQRLWTGSCEGTVVLDGAELTTKRAPE